MFYSWCPKIHIQGMGEAQTDISHNINYLYHGKYCNFSQMYFSETAVSATVVAFGIKNQEKLDDKCSNWRDRLALDQTNNRHNSYC